MRSLISIALFFLLCAATHAEKLQAPPAPDWARNLIIYEIATKAFTSPNGPESGTFVSLKERVPYLAGLGINAVWLTGWNLANDHFFGIWSQYATIDPSKLDPSLGTDEDFKSLIAELHKYGIKIFLDSTEHGVVSDSPLVKQHANWFHGGSWRMADYDWKDKNGPHPDLDQWWIGYWMRWITEFGIDGARLDVEMGKPPVWAEIKRRAAAAGHPIAIISEALSSDPISDFGQRTIPLPLRLDGPMQTDLAKLFGGAPAEKIQSLQLSSHDYPEYAAAGSPFYFGYYLFAPANYIFMSGEEFGAEFKALPRLSPDLYGEKPPGPKSKWLYGCWLQWDQLQEKEHAAMLAAVKRLIAIRNRESDLVRACGHGVAANIVDIDSTAPNDAGETFARPYLLWNQHHALLVGGHTNTARSVSFTWILPVDKLAWNTTSYKITDLWGTRGAKVISAAGLAKMDVTIGPDRTPDGGLALFEIEPADRK